MPLPQCRPTMGRVPNFAIFKDNTGYRNTNSSAWNSLTLIYCGSDLGRVTKLFKHAGVKVYTIRQYASLSPSDLNAYSLCKVKFRKL